MPLFVAAHEAPLSCVTKAPAPAVPAKTRLFKAVKLRTLVSTRPLFDTFHDIPMSDEMLTPPPSVPSKTLLPRKATAVAPKFAQAKVIDQVSPLSLERQSPPPGVPTKTVVPLAAK